MSVVDETHPLTLHVEAPLDSGGASLIREAIRREIGSGHEECLRWFCLHPSTPEDALIEIYDRGLCRDELGHRRSPRKLVEKMALEAKYPEAILTLAIHLYTDADESTDAFAAFAERNSENLWMLDSLVRQIASSSEKTSRLERLISRHSQADRLKRLLEVNRWAQQARSTNDLNEIDRLYATNEPDVWLALAANPSLPRCVLERLADAKDVRLARQIRNRARAALDAS